MIIFDKQNIKVSTMEEETQRGDFWNNPQEAQKILSELNKLRKLDWKGKEALREKY